MLDFRSQTSTIIKSIYYTKKYMGDGKTNRYYSVYKPTSIEQKKQDR